MSDFVILLIGIAVFIFGYWLGWHDHQGWLNHLLEEYVRTKYKERKDKGGEDESDKTEINN